MTSVGCVHDFTICHTYSTYTLNANTTDAQNIILHCTSIHNQQHFTYGRWTVVCCLVTQLASEPNMILVRVRSLKYPINTFHLLGPMGLSFSCYEKQYVYATGRFSGFLYSTKSRNEMTKRNDEIKQRNHRKTARFTESNFGVPVYIRGTFRYILCGPVRTYFR